jgi:hypothetical protein
LVYRVLDAHSVAADADASSTPSLRARVGNTGDAPFAPRFALGDWRSLRFLNRSSRGVHRFGVSAVVVPLLHGSAAAAVGSAVVSDALDAHPSLWLVDAELHSGSRSVVGRR